MADMDLEDDDPIIAPSMHPSYTPSSMFHPSSTLDYYPHVVDPFYAATTNTITGAMGGQGGGGLPILPPALHASAASSSPSPLVHGAGGSGGVGRIGSVGVPAAASANPYLRYPATAVASMPGIHAMQAAPRQKAPSGKIPSWLTEAFRSERDREHAEALKRIQYETGASASCYGMRSVDGYAAMRDTLSDSDSDSEQGPLLTASDYLPPSVTNVDEDAFLQSNGGSKVRKSTKRSWRDESDDDDSHDGENSAKSLSSDWTADAGLRQSTASLDAGKWKQAFVRGEVVDDDRESKEVSSSPEPMELDAFKRRELKKILIAVFDAATEKLFYEVARDVLNEMFSMPDNRTTHTDTPPSTSRTVVSTTMPTVPFLPNSNSNSDDEADPPITSASGLLGLASYASSSDHSDSEDEEGDDARTSAVIRGKSGISSRVDNVTTSHPASSQQRGTSLRSETMEAFRTGTWTTPIWGMREDEVGEPRFRIVSLFNRKDQKSSAFSGSSMIIGQGAEADIEHSHDTVDSVHAVFQIHRDGSVYVVDLGSTHGTFVNHRRLQPFEPRLIEEADVLTLGSSTREYRVLPVLAPREESRSTIASAIVSSTVEDSSENVQNSDRKWNMDLPARDMKRSRSSSPSSNSPRSSASPEESNREPERKRRESNKEDSRRKYSPSSSTFSTSHQREKSRKDEHRKDSRDRSRHDKSLSKSRHSERHEHSSERHRSRRSSSPSRSLRRSRSRSRSRSPHHSRSSHRDSRRSPERYSSHHSRSSSRRH